jgi:hypothetical protein
MKELYYRIVTALTLPKRDDGYSTETVVVTALLILTGLAVATGIGAYAQGQIDRLGQ